MEKNEKVFAHSKLNMISYGFGNFFNEFFTLAFGAFGFFFYESEIGLNVWLVGLGYIIFAVWNMINDPLVGYLTNRPFKFTKKWGRRFPFIVLAGIPYILSYVLIFTPPAVDPQSGALILFGWLILATCLFDTFASIYWVNFSSLFPDKFRSVEERRRATGLQIPLGILGVALGAIVPPLFITFGNLQSYVIQAFVVVVICFSALMLAIPGVKEDKETINRYLEKLETEQDRSSFFQTLKTVLKQRSFVTFIVIYLAYQTVITSMTASIPYAVRFILEMPASATTLIFAGFLIGALFSIPFWIKFAHKSNDNRKVLLTAGLLLALFTSPLIFINNYVIMIIAMVIWGLALGGFWAMIAPVLADVIDESVATSGKREEGVITGIQRFFGRLAIVIQAMSFVFAHSLTGFAEGADTQTPLAVWGIHVHLALVPFVIMLIGTLIFWKFYNLTPERVAKNQERVDELGL
ncbi:MAG: MFS transporter [Candidatus Lokiarchaeota archaeon]|nr:MFS transporter [Candidatus Lokiarchaeota archaeon]MBD3339140.1 MFS transporter [Candidatus Lokiarchaeota archaeon]